jgi:CheY-like chemotaxis protein
LTQCGAQVRCAASVADAVYAVRAWVPDVLISDIGMPGEDGYSLVGKLRAGDDADETHTAPPALALTAYASVEDRARALDAGFDMHMAKPVEPGELIAVVAALAGRYAKA